MIRSSPDFAKSVKARELQFNRFFFPPAASEKLILLEHLQQSTPPKPQLFTRRPGWLIILLLGGLSLITPFSVDMYLPAFSRIATQFHTTTPAVSWSLSTYFIGFAFGQILYGPLLDRFGRKRPLYVGLTLYLIASALCTHPGSLRVLIALRFLQAIGGCVAQVASVAMVRDFFPPDQSARILSLTVPHHRRLALACAHDRQHHPAVAWMAVDLRCSFLLHTRRDLGGCVSVARTAPAGFQASR